MKQQRYYGILLCSLALAACGHNEQDKQAEAERVTQAYQQAAIAAQEQQAEAERQARINNGESGAPFEVKLPPPPAEPTDTPAQIAAMTNPDQVASLLLAKSPDQRMAAVRQLEMLASQKSLPDSALQRLINVFDADADVKVSGAAAHALGQICHPAVMVSLQNNLNRDLDEINPETIRVLGEVAGYRTSQFLDDFIKQLEDNHTPLAQNLSQQAEAAKAAILARGGRPPKCTW